MLLDGTGQFFWVETSGARTVRLAAPVGTTDYVRSTLLLVGSNQTPAGDAAIYDGFFSET